MENFSHSHGREGTWKPLREHLIEVAWRAACYGSFFGASTQTQLSALLHDLGKYGELFQQRLLGKERGIDHWTIGASACLVFSGFKKFSIAPAIAVLGHHIGLQRADGASLRALIQAEKLNPSDHALRLSHTGENPQDLLVRWQADGLKLPDPPEVGIADKPEHHAAFMNDTRFIFSALTDADFIQTEAHFEGKQPEDLGRDSGPTLQPDRLLAAIDLEIQQAQLNESSEAVRQLRSQTLDHCSVAALSPTGLFTLTAPTGSGKTLAAFRFAAAHAQKFGLRRIIYVAPYLTIFDQTSALLRRVMSRMGLSPSEQDRYLLEHASLTRLDLERPEESDPDSQTASNNRLLQARFSENWDAPFIITTNVQILESLFANRPSKCRKLHRIAKSVILFDEIQTLPNDLACATLSTLSRLTEQPFSSTIVFMTATQPAFTELHSSLQKNWFSSWQPTEIIQDIPQLFTLSKRYQSEWPVSAARTTWGTLATEISSLPEPQQALVIVNVKRHALELLRSLPESISTRHLSTSMCPKHRTDVLSEVIEDLHAKRSLILVATQCVEAGVDLDFPVVYRAMGPLDSIAQAAGRCNRNGNRPTGILRIFEPPDNALPPDRGYSLGTAATSAMLRKKKGYLDLHDPVTFHEYYQRLYQITGLGEIKDELFEAIQNHDFPEVARLYRIIQDNTVQVVVPYQPEIFERLHEQLQKDGFSSDWIRQARPHTVNVFRTHQTTIEEFCTPVMKHPHSGEIIPDWWLLRNPDHYDQKTGLQFPTQGDVLHV